MIFKIILIILQNYEYVSELGPVVFKIVKWFFLETLLFVNKLHLLFDLLPFFYFGRIKITKNINILYFYFVYFLFYFVFFQKIQAIQDISILFKVSN